MTRREPMATWPCDCKVAGCWCHARVGGQGWLCSACAQGSHARLPLPWPAQGPQGGRAGAPWPIRTPRPKEPIR